MYLRGECDDFVKCQEISMRKVIVSIFVTLDGYIADDNGDLNWSMNDDAINQYSLKILNATGTMLLGRKTYELFRSYWPTANEPGSKELNSMEKVVFSRTLDAVDWGEWGKARLVKDNIAEEVNRLKAQPGKDMVIFAGAGIISTFRKLDLIDEYRLLLHPVVLGRGLSLFEQGDEPLKLKLLSAEPLQEGVVLLTYQPESKS
jgi:dihydrofolate reductase